MENQYDHFNILQFWNTQIEFQKQFGYLDLDLLDCIL